MTSSLAEALARTRARLAEALPPSPKRLREGGLR